jgi:excisionase family DNA binding protein
MTVRRMIAEGRIPAIQLGGRGTSIRIDEAELERWLYADDVTRLEQGILAAIERDDGEELERLRSEYRRVATIERPATLALEQNGRG